MNLISLGRMLCHHSANSILMHTEEITIWFCDNFTETYKTVYLSVQYY